MKEERIRRWEQVIGELFGPDASSDADREQIRQWAEDLEANIGDAVEDPRVKAKAKEILKEIRED